MKTKHTNTWMVFTMLLIFSSAVQAQHTEIEYDSNGGDPQLLLKESGTGGGFSRLTMQNTLPGFWTLAARNGSGTTDDDFNIYYDDGTSGVNIINIDGDGNKTNFTSAVEVIDEDVTISGVDPDLILSSDATGDPAILFGDNGGTGDSRIWYDSSEDMLRMGTSTINGAVNIDNDDRVGVNEENDLTSQMTIKANAGNTVIPAHLELRENNNSQGGRMHFTNSNDSHWEIHGKPGVSTNASSTGIMDINYFNNTTELSVAAFDGKNERTGIRDDTPEYTFSVDHRSGSPDNSVGSRYGFNLENTSNSDSWTFYTRTSSGGDLRLYYDSNTQDAINPILRGTFNSADGVYTNNSDIRLKKNITTLENQLEKVMKLRPTRYQFNDYEVENQEYSLGLIAQEVQKILPDVVSHITEKEEDGTDYLGIAYTELIPVLIGAIQDQQHLIEKKITDYKMLKSEMASLRAMIEELKSSK